MAVLGSDNISHSTTFKFNINSADRVTIDDSGKVGIGTTNPAVELQVNGTARAKQILSTDTTQGTASLALRALGTGTNDAQIAGEFTDIGFTAARSSDGAIGTTSRIRSISESGYVNSWPTSLAFFVRRFDNDFESVRFDSIGNLLIGGTLPSAPNITLNANGSGNFSGALTTGPGSALNGVYAYRVNVAVTGSSTYSKTFTVPNGGHVSMEFSYVSFASIVRVQGIVAKHTTLVARYSEVTSGGVKSTTATGAVNISLATNTITFSKTSGTDTGFGTLNIMVFSTLPITDW
jgi:hypothetical protein